MGVGESNKTMQQDLHIFGKPITTHHSSDSTWLHNTLALLISRNPQWLSCSVPGRRADWESFCRSLERSLDVNNKPDFGESKPKDHDILATVPAVPGCAFPRNPQDWGDTGFGIILGNGCSKNFLNPKHRSSNAKYDRSCSFDILFDIPKPSALNAFWVKTLAAFSKVAAATSTCNWNISHSGRLRSKANFHLHGEVHPKKGSMWYFCARWHQRNPKMTSIQRTSLVLLVPLQCRDIGHAGRKGILSWISNPK